LSHDLLVSKKGIVAPANHVLKLAITRRKARLSSEFAKARIKNGCATLEAFKEAVSNGLVNGEQDATTKVLRHPRWVRVNTVNTTMEEQLRTTFKEFEASSSLEQVMASPGSRKMYFLDPNIPNLLALPPDSSLGKSSAYTTGQIIFQDKASCFPAYLLDIQAGDGDVIDGCAAPGNKTTHIAAFMSQQSAENDAFNSPSKIIAFERDENRAKILQRMVKLASADNIVKIKGGQDFLATKPDSNEFAGVGAILLDPSCSGSGMVERDVIKVHIPELTTQSNAGPQSSKSKKRKRGKNDEVPTQQTTSLKVELDDADVEETPVEDKLSERLTALSTFQLHILKHAMQFPRARKITYSTCSIYFEENEGVVFQALDSVVARKNGWRVLKREEQVDGMKRWVRRGIWEDDKLETAVVKSKDEVLEACIRCDKGTAEGTMGFFVAGFVRDNNSVQGSNELTREEDIQEWNGFSDEEGKVHETTITSEDGRSLPLEDEDDNSHTLASAHLTKKSKRNKKKKKQME
jgi:putative methyltransferase